MACGAAVEGDQVLVPELSHDLDLIHELHDPPVVVLIEALHGHVAAVFELPLEDGAVAAVSELPFGVEMIGGLFELVVAENVDSGLLKIFRHGRK